MNLADLFQSMTRNIQGRFRAALIAMTAMTAVVQCVAQTAPTISGLSPNGGQAGTSVTISGSGFGSTQSTSTVTFNGTIAVARGRNATSWSNTSIVVVVPAGATSGSVIVKVGTQASNPMQFNVGTAITGISPSSGAPGTMVTVNGAGFGATQGSSTITFNGVAASPTSWSDGSIAVPVPSGAATGNVVVTVGSLASNGMNFIVVVKSAATITLSSSASASVYGSSVNFTAAVTPSNATGTVTFNDGGTSLGTATISAGSASLTSPTLAAGSHSITAAYGGDNNYGAAQSAALTQIVNQASVTLALAVSPGGTPNFGTPMTFTATVTPSNLTGNITFADGSTILGIAAISNGQAAYTTSSLGTGAHSITASFTGSSNYSTSVSQAQSAPVGPAAVTVKICCAGSAVYGTSPQFNVTITPVNVNPNHTTPTGEVFVQDNDISHTLCDILETNSSVSCQPMPFVLTGGNHNILANYNDPTGIYRDYSTFPPSIAWIVTPAASSVTLASDSPNNTSHTSQQVTFTATVTGVAGGATPTGSVVFNDAFNGATTQLGTETVGTNGQAILITFNLQAGQHSIQAVYNQDNTDKNYQSSTSSAVQQTVNVIPIISSMVPSGGPAGMGFTIAGTTFGNTAGKVTINGVQATILQWSDTQITLQVPGAGAGMYTPVITTSDNKMSDPNSKSQFTVRDRIVVCQQ